MGLLIFGVVIVISSVIVFVFAMREKDITLWGKIAFLSVVIGYFIIGLTMVMFNNYTFNKHIQMYKKGDYKKSIIVDTEGKEIEVRYKCY